MRRWSARLVSSAFVVMVVAGLYLTAHAQDEPSAAVTLVKARRYQEAIPLLTRLVEEATAAGRKADAVVALAHLASALYHSDDLTGARVRALEGLALAERLQDQERLGQLRLLLSILDDLAGEAATARTWALKADEAYRAGGHTAGSIEARLQVKRVSSIGIDQARTLLEEAAADARALGDTVLEARVLHALGDALFSAGQLDLAYDALMRALPLLEAVDRPIDLGTLHNSLGRVYRAHGRLDDALAMQMTALRLHERGGDTFTIMQSLNAVGTVYQRLGDVQTARQFTERALALAVQLGSTRARDFLQANLGGLLLNEGEAAKAAAVLEVVIAAGRDNFIATRYIQLADAYVRLGRHDAALSAAQQAIDRCGDAQDVCIQAQAARAEARAAAGDAEAALSDLNGAHSRLEALRASLVASDAFRRGFPVVYERLFADAIALQLRQGRVREALETAERSRARAFLDLLAARALIAEPRAADELLVAVPAAADAAGPTDEADVLAQVTRRGGARGDPAAPASAPHQQGGARSSLAAARPATADDLAATAARLDSTLLVYWVAEAELFIWVVPPRGEVHSRRVPVLRSTLARLVRETSPFSSPPATGAPPLDPHVLTRGNRQVPTRRARAAVWRELHALLLEPIRPMLPKSSGALLTVVPHGPLVGLSFAALRTTQNRYLLEDYTLHYAPAGALLDFTSARRRADARTGPTLLVADPEPPRLSALDEPLPRLPGARLETSAIERLSSPGQATSLVGADATESSVRAQVDGRAVLHFATHAIVRDDDPFASYLALGVAADAAAGDGRLSAGEVYGLTLRADLVVLSACQSAGGLVGGDGVATFARAFLYAGSASLLASVWDVADEPTNRLLPEFYRAWRGGSTKAQALRQAQLQLLGDLRAGRVSIDTPLGLVPVSEHPVFWAGFALFGEPD